MVFVASNVASSRSVAAPAVDHRLDQIERQYRAGITAADDSYTQVETQRGATTVAGPKADRRFDELILAPAAAPFSDGSYDQAEKNRGGASSGATKSTTKVGGTAPEYGSGRIQGHRRAMIEQ
jgi:hypothetical protein